MNAVEKLAETTGIHRRLLDEIRITFEDSLDYSLTHLGGQEMQEIAARYQKRFPNIFNTKNLHIVSSGKERSIKSAQHFLRGLYENHEEFYDQITINNRMMRLFAECSNYHEQVKQNKSAYSQLDMFRRSEQVDALIKKLKFRHNILDLEMLDSSKFIFSLAIYFIFKLTSSLI